MMDRTQALAEARRLGEQAARATYFATGGSEVPPFEVSVSRMRQLRNEFASWGMVNSADRRRATNDLCRAFLEGAGAVKPDPVKKVPKRKVTSHASKTGKRGKGGKKVVAKRRATNPFKRGSLERSVGAGRV